MENSARYQQYKQQHVAHWDAVARQRDTWQGWGGYYHRRINKIYRFLCGTDARILEIGCGQGELLAALEPAQGVGIDFSPAMIERARQKYPQFRFVEADAHSISLPDKFDVIILSDLVNDLWDVETVFQQIVPLTTPRTRIILNFFSRMWELPLALAQKMRLANPSLPQNWLTVADIANLLGLADFEVTRHWEEILLPLPFPLLSGLANNYLAKIWPFWWGDLTHFMVARPCPQATTEKKNPTVSVIVPARNEAGNIADIFRRTPQMGDGTELIFVEGGSRDNTYEVIAQAMQEYPGTNCKLLKQTGKGKGDAVRVGFTQASGDILLILDADLTVPPEDLPRFVAALSSGKGDFINGVRLVYPMEKQAMRFLNLIANKFFSAAFSWLLGQTIKDTLCGTKVLWREDYELIAANRPYFGDFDPFGDFDLLFGAAKLNLKIVDLPIRYRERIYGTTNIQRWRHGWLLLQMVVFAARRIKFI